MAAQVWLLRYTWVGLPTLAALTFAGAAVLTAIDRRFVGLVLLFTYLYPALIRIGHGPYHVYFGVLWMAALLGALVPDGLRTSWHVPARWRAALALWALVIAAGTPIVILREMDFFPGLVAISSAPSFAARWALHVALTLVLGILWFDWLFGARDLDFHTGVATPLAVSTFLMASVAAYQLFGDFSFLNQNVFGGTGRANGSVFDANVCGAVAALWTGGFVLWGQRLGRWRAPLVSLGFAAAWLAVWASGSRTALMSAAIVTGFSLVGLAVSLRHGIFRLTARRLTAAASAAVVFVLLLTFANDEVVGPAGRLWNTLPEASAASWLNFVVEMWDRRGYGSAATTMIRESPLVGVGVSSYHTLVSSLAPTRLPPDNAQNWYRHQFAEFGPLGSLGWIAWVALFASFVLRPRPGAPAVTWTARGVLMAFAVISLVGMPGQHVIVAITFWTFAFWYVSIVGAPSPGPAISRRSWAAIAAVVIAYAAGTVYVSANRLRPPVRAQWLGGGYEYGFYQPEPDADGREFRWAARGAAIVLDAPARWLEVTVGVNHRDIEERPVEAKVWVDRKLVIDTRLMTAAPTAQVVRVPDDEPRVLLETRVSRVLVPRDFGVNDARELGLMVKWRFLDAPEAER